MHLDDVIAGQKRGALMWAAFVGGLVLANLVPAVGAWQMTAIVTPMVAMRWLITRRDCRPWAGLSGGFMVAGSLFLDYLHHRTIPAVSPYVFLGAWFILMMSFEFWLGRKEQRATATGAREPAIRA